VAVLVGGRFGLWLCQWPFWFVAFWDVCPPCCTTCSYSCAAVDKILTETMHLVVAELVVVVAVEITVLLTLMACGGAASVHFSHSA